MDVFLFDLLPLILLAGMICALLLFCKGAFEALSRGDLQSRLRHERQADDFESFRTLFVPARCPDAVIQEVYDHLSNRVFLRGGFPVRPTDNLHEVYDIGPQNSNDLDLLLRTLAGKLNLAYSPRSSSELPPCTVAELVEYVAKMPGAGQPTGSSTLLRPSQGGNDNLLMVSSSTKSGCCQNLLRPDSEI